MKKVSRSIIYKEKESIGIFLGEGDTLERYFINNLLKRPFMQELQDTSVNILRLFNNAFYICTLVYEGDYPLLDLKEYEKVAIDGHDDPIWTNHIFPATMALVVIWLNSDEGQQLYKNNSQKKNIEELCKGICVDVEESNTLPEEGKEDFRALISYEHRLPSGFINERCLQRRPLAEVLVDPIVGKNEVFDNMEYLFDKIKNNTKELTAALESDYIKEMASKLSFNENEVISSLTEWLENKSKDNGVAEYNANTDSLNLAKSLNPKQIVLANQCNFARVVQAMVSARYFKRANGDETNATEVGGMLLKLFGVTNEWKSVLQKAFRVDNPLSTYDELRDAGQEYWENRVGMDDAIRNKKKKKN